MPPDSESRPHHRSVARFFVENRHVSWVLLVGVIAWGIWAYAAMPKRKDPDIPVRQVAVVTPWPGQSAERVEQLVTRKIEERVAQNIRVSETTSTTRQGLSVVYAEVDENARIETGKEFDDIKVKLDALTDLPEGAGPIQYINEFGETSALMLTVASPPASDAQLQLLAKQVAAAAPNRQQATWTYEPDDHDHVPQHAQTRAPSSRANTRGAGKVANDWQSDGTEAPAEQPTETPTKPLN
jgi:hypothetical protein